MGGDRIDTDVRGKLWIESGGDDPMGGGGPGEDLEENRDYNRDYSRDLGVIEAISYVTRSCPSGVVVSAAERALDAIKDGGSDVMKTQAYYVLTAMKGWRGERAIQVHRSLTRYLAEAQQTTENSTDK